MRKTPSTFFLAALSLFSCNCLVSGAYGHSLVFGPEFFYGEEGKPRRVVKNFSVQDDNRQFIISVQSGMNNGKEARGAVNLNGQLIFPPDKIGNRPGMLAKSVRLKRQNTISVEMPGEAAAPAIVTIMSLKEQTVAAKVPPIGKAVELDGYATIVFPAGTFDRTQDVTIAVTASPSVRDIFDTHATGPRLPYEIRINSGDKAPRKDIEVSLKYPDSFYSSHYQIHVFAHMFDNPDEPDLHDRFFLISSGLDDIIEMAMATLPKHAFSNRHRKNGAYEAIITVGLVH